MITTQNLKKQILEKKQFNQFTMPMIAAMAGDSTLLKKDKTVFEKALKERGNQVYADILYTLVNFRFKPSDAIKHWNNIIKHKKFLESKLKRKCGLNVASLDYFTNIAKLFTEITLIPEPKLNSVIEIALKDNLTGLYDNHTFKQMIEFEYNRSKKYNNSFSIIIIDIDNFKWFNDTYGHLAGDKLLKNISSILKLKLPFSDNAFRVGGDEFCLIFSDNLQVAHLNMLKNIIVPFRKKYPKLGLSMGIANAGLPKVHSGNDLYVLADKALYKAKKNGKNKIGYYENEKILTV